MADFKEIGTYLFTLIIVINLFATGFGGVPLPSTYENFVITDLNTSSNSFNENAGAFNLTPYATPASAQGTNPNNPIQQDVINRAPDILSLAYGAAFGINNVMIFYGAPTVLLFTFGNVINILMLIFILQFSAQILAQILTKVT